MALGTVNVAPPKLPEDALSGGVFVATYGVTTMAEIVAAQEAGKMLVCDFSAMTLPVVSGIQGIFYNFYGGTDEDGYMATISSDDGWTYTEFGGYTPKSHDHKIPKPARFVVGTSTNGWTENDCDYLCDGEADDVEINAAITALPSAGGEVVLLDGTYNITAAIKLGKAGVTLRGNGQATKLIRAFSGSYVIYLSGGYGVVDNLLIDGVSGTYTSSSKAIYALSGNNVVRNCFIQNNSDYGIHFAASKNKAIGNTITKSYTGIHVADNENIIEGNICLENLHYGIHIEDDHNVVTGNIARLNSVANFYMFYAGYCTITGNNFAVEDGDDVTPKAIHLYGTANHDNIVTDNNIGDGAITNGGGTNNIVGTVGGDLITYGTTDLTAGTSALETGKVYLVYE